LWDVYQSGLSGNETAAFECALRWVVEPTEANRRRAEPHANLDTVAGCLAFAVFWSGGSLVAPELPILEPPEHITAATVGPAILLLAGETAPDAFASACRRLLAMGLQVAHGNHLWHERIRMEPPRAPANAPAETTLPAEPM